MGEEEERIEDAAELAKVRRQARDIQLKAGLVAVLLVGISLLVY